MNWSDVYASSGSVRDSAGFGEFTGAWDCFEFARGHDKFARHADPIDLESPCHFAGSGWADRERNAGVLQAAYLPVDPYRKWGLRNESSIETPETK